MEKCNGTVIPSGFPSQKLGQDPPSPASPTKANQWRHSSMTAHWELWLLIIFNFMKCLCGEICCHYFVVAIPISWFGQDSCFCCLRACRTGLLLPSHEYSSVKLDDEAAGGVQILALLQELMFYWTEITPPILIGNQDYRTWVTDFLIAIDCRVNPKKKAVA